MKSTAPYLCKHVQHAIMAASNFLREVSYHEHELCSWLLRQYQMVLIWYATNGTGPLIRNHVGRVSFSWSGIHEIIPQIQLTFLSYKTFISPFEAILWVTFFTFRCSPVFVPHFYWYNPLPWASNNSVASQWQSSAQENNSPIFRGVVSGVLLALPSYYI